jgi:hypothetical protein
LTVQRLNQKPLFLTQSRKVAKKAFKNLIFDRLAKGCHACEIGYPVFM